jgi:hypothetical protein
VKANDLNELHGQAAKFVGANGPALLEEAYNSACLFAAAANIPDEDIDCFLLFVASMLRAQLLETFGEGRE